MVAVYTIATVAGFVALVGWILIHAGGEGSRYDPEERLGSTGRRAVSAVLGFGLAGLSAEFSPLSIPWPVAFVLAVVGGVAMAVIAHRLAASVSDGG